MHCFKVGIMAIENYWYRGDYWYRELVVGIIASCRLEVLGVGVVIGFSFEGFCFVDRFLKLYDIIGNLCITGWAGFEKFTHK